MLDLKADLTEFAVSLRLLRLISKYLIIPHLLRLLQPRCQLLRHLLRLDITHHILILLYKVVEVDHCLYAILLKLLPNLLGNFSLLQAGDLHQDLFNRLQELARLRVDLLELVLVLVLGEVAEDWDFAELHVELDSPDCWEVLDKDLPDV